MNGEIENAQNRNQKLKSLLEIREAEFSRVQKNREKAILDLKKQTDLIVKSHHENIKNLEDIDKPEKVLENIAKNSKSCLKNLKKFSRQFEEDGSQNSNSDNDSSSSSERSP